MAADLYIHIRTPDVTRENLTVFSAEYRSGDDDTAYHSAMNLIGESPMKWIGEVSWLKAALLNKPEEYVPETVDIVVALIPDDVFTLITNPLIEKVAQAFDLENKGNYIP